MAGKHPLFLILILSMIGMGDGGSLGAQERTAPPEIDVTTLRVQVKPQLEFVMPLGIVNQAMIIPMGMAQMRSTVGFDIPGALITADVSLRRRFGQWEPELRGAQDLSTGAILDPQIDASGINLGGNADSIVRVRSVGGALRWMPPDRSIVSRWGNGLSNPSTTRSRSICVSPLYGTQSPSINSGWNRDS